MRPITFAAQLFGVGGDDPVDQWRSEHALGHLLRALCAINCDYLRAYPRTPNLYDAGVRYQAELDEEWRAIPRIIEMGEGDCEDLACWRSSELNVRARVAATPVIKRGIFNTSTGRVRMYHILVRWPDGTLEDPSRALGMRG